MKLITRIGLVCIFLISNQTRAKVEDWYTFWGLGVSNISYSGERKTEIESFRQGDSSVTGRHLNAFGFYFPIDNNSIYGVVAQGVTSTFTVASHIIDKINYNDSMLAFSYMKFYGNEIGDGLFYRADFGYAQATRTISLKTSNAKDNKYKYGNGVSALLAGGYAIETSEQSRLLISLEYKTGFVSDHQMNSLGLTVNGLW